MPPLPPLKADAGAAGSASAGAASAGPAAESPTNTLSSASSTAGSTASVLTTGSGGLTRKTTVSDKSARPAEKIPDTDKLNKMLEPIMVRSPPSADCSVHGLAPPAAPPS